MLYSIANNAPVPWLGEPIDDVRYPLNIETLWSPDDLAAIGLYIPLAADPVPSGKNVTGQHVELVDGMPKWVLELEDVPAPPDPPAPTADDVWAEKDRRWALGFDFTFDDARGTHHIATTPKDMTDWNKVSMAAQAAINVGAPDSPIGIYTATSGAVKVDVTAMEWQQIILAAAGFFQSVMDHAAALVVREGGIPTDYADDTYWTEAN